MQLRLPTHSPASVFKFGFFGCWRRECEVGAEGDLKTAKESWDCSEKVEQLEVVKVEIERAETNW